MKNVHRPLGAIRTLVVKESLVLNRTEKWSRDFWLLRIGTVFGPWDTTTTQLGECGGLRRTWVATPSSSTLIVGRLAHAVLSCCLSQGRGLR